ncbi:MAG: lipopolysaccharide heptosyltransferase II [Deltaproteobacteria bacterium]|jgi:heptosyltransferase-2|nr:lipopolysaccharide heptosyltransferase II [Deltaproteobacteria bacterium]
MKLPPKDVHPSNKLRPPKKSSGDPPSDEQILNLENPLEQLDSSEFQSPEPHLKSTPDLSISGEKKAVLVRGLNWLGDSVISLPALNALKNTEEHEITVLARGAGANLYREIPYLRRVIEDQRGFVKRVNLIKALKFLNFPSSILLQNAFGAALITYLAGIPVRIGYSRDLREKFLTKSLPVGFTNSYTHEVFNYLELVEASGVPAPFTFPEIPQSLGTPQNPQPPNVIPFSPKKSKGFLLTLAPGASFGSAKRWSALNFARSAKLILSGHPRGKIVILGGDTEIEDARTVANNLKGLEVTNLAGQTNLSQVMTIFKNSSLVISNDSGLSHLAGALGAPVVVPFGPTNPLTTGPLGLQHAIARKAVHCSPCLKRECPLKERICFTGVTPELVAFASDKLLEKTPEPAQKKNWVILTNIPLGVLQTAWEAPPQVDLIIVLPQASRLTLPPTRKSQESFSSAKNNIPLPKGLLMSNTGYLKPAGFFRKIYPVYYFPDGTNPSLFYRDLSQSLGLSINQTTFISTEMDALSRVLKLGARAVLTINDSLSGIPQNIFQEAILPTIAAPNLQRALEWAGALR